MGHVSESVGYHDEEGIRAFIADSDAKAEAICDLLDAEHDEFSVSALMEEIASLLQSYPLQRFLDMAERKGCMRALREKVVAYSRLGIVAEVSAKLGGDTEPFDVAMGQCEDYWFLLALNWVGDRNTAIHCIDTFAHKIAASRARLAMVSDLDVGAEHSLDVGALLHDGGKGNVPRVVLDCPFSPGQLEAMWRSNLVDPKRFKHRRPLLVGVPLDEPGLVERFGPLVSGLKNGDPALEEAYFNLFVAGGGDVRQLPLRTLFSVAKSYLATGQFPDAVRKFLKREPTDEEREGMLQSMRTQEPILAKIDAVFRLFGLDGWRTTFLGALSVHARASGTLVVNHVRNETSGRLAGIVANHHCYHEPPPAHVDGVQDFGMVEDIGDKRAVTALRICDMVSAITDEKRAYVGVRPRRSLGDVRRIFDGEVRRHHIDPEAAREFARTYLVGDSNCLEVRAAIAFNAAEAVRRVSRTGVVV